LPDVRGLVSAHHEVMLMTGSDAIDAERAFTRSARARRRAAMARRLRRRGDCGDRLAVYDERELTGSGAPRGIREVPIDAIAGTLEPSRAAMFDSAFRPAATARARWERVWLAERRGTVLPPVSLARVGDRYVIRDGHHRVSVAKARGALTIDATLDGLA
jgi:hypothetical protein